MVELSCNRNFLVSPPGVLIILELLFGLLCWALIAPLSQSYFPAAYQFVMFVSVTAWIFTLLFFIIFVCGFHATQCSGLPWGATAIFFNLTVFMWYLVAAIVSAVYARSLDQLIAATFFAFFADACYLIQSFIGYRQWRGSFPWQSNASSSGVTVNA